jgi:hypothetical protein
MSKPNKANKSNYDQAGRLTPDELAREHKKQATISPPAKDVDRITGTARQKGGAQDDTRPRSAPEE